MVTKLRRQVTCTAKRKVANVPRNRSGAARWSCKLLSLARLILGILKSARARERSWCFLLCVTRGTAAEFRREWNGKRMLSVPKQGAVNQGANEGLGGRLGLGGLEHLLRFEREGR